MDFLKKIHLILFLTHLTRFTESFILTSSCAGREIVNGRQCHSCAPGYFKIEDCVTNPSTGCRKCPTNTFQPDCTSTARECKTCSVCQVKQVTLQECTETNDQLCQCKQGYFWVPDISKTDEGYCKRHSLCDIGFGVKVKGTATEDTKCESCTEGKTFSNESLEGCTNCTVCTLYEHNCTRNSDAVCREDPATQQHPASGELDDNLTRVVLPTLSVVVVLAVGFGIWCYRRRQRNQSKLLDLKARTRTDPSGLPNIQETDDDSSRSESHSLRVTYGENDIEADVVPVPPNSFEPQCERQIDGHRDRTIPNGITTSPPTSTRIQDDRRIDLERQDHRVPANRTVDTRNTIKQEVGWRETITYLCRSVSRQDFLQIYRKMACKHTDFENRVESEIDNKRAEHGPSMNEEVVYQLMRSMKQEIPSLSPQDVLSAMAECRLLDYCEKLRAKLSEIHSSQSGSENIELSNLNNSPTLVHAELQDTTIVQMV